MLQPEVLTAGQGQQRREQGLQAGTADIGREEDTP